MSKGKTSIQVIGYGNPGRQDDGLGPAFAKSLRHMGYTFPISDPYQLTVEDALSFSDDTLVIFVDAAKSLPSPFTFEEVHPGTEHGLSSHSVSPESLLQLSETVFSVRPRAYILAIKGYEFDDFEESLSPKAQQNLDDALAFFEHWFSREQGNEHNMQRHGGNDEIKDRIRHA